MRDNIMNVYSNSDELKTNYTVFGAESFEYNGTTYPSIYDYANNKCAEANNILETNQKLRNKFSQLEAGPQHRILYENKHAKMDIEYYDNLLNFIDIDDGEIYFQEAAGYRQFYKVELCSKSIFRFELKPSFKLRYIPDTMSLLKISTIVDKELLDTKIVGEPVPVANISPSSVITTFSHGYSIIQNPRCYTYTEETAQKLIDEFEEDGELRKCTEHGCNEIFYITYNQIKWFVNKNLSIPTRCEDCRDAKKRRQKEFEEAQREAKINSEVKIGITVYRAGDYMTSTEAVIVTEDNILSIKRYWNSLYFKDKQNAQDVEQASINKYNAYLYNW